MDIPSQSKKKAILFNDRDLPKVPEDVAPLQEQIPVP
jgi:hypothetical protein